MSPPGQPPETAGATAAPARRGLSNRGQKLLFVALTLLLTAAVVGAGRTLLRNSETLTFAVGPPDGTEARFAAKLAAVLKANNSRLTLKPVATADAAKALAQFERRQADLAILRTDDRIPGRARALAILDKDVLLIISPKGKPIKTLAALRKTKIMLQGNSADDAFLRRLLQSSDQSDTALRIQTAAPGAPLQTLLSGGGAVAVVAHVSSIRKDRGFEQYARKAGFTLNAVAEAKAIENKQPGVTAETLETGMLSSSPAIPDDDLETLSLQWLLVAQARLSTGVASELARIIYENKSDLALDDGFASRIEPADTDKDAFVAAHAGAAQYINDDTKSFIERYSDVLYLGVAALGVIGSLFAGLYAKVTRTAPQTAGALVQAILDIGARADGVGTRAALDELQADLEATLHYALIGLGDGAVSSDGIATLRLGYDMVRDKIRARQSFFPSPPAGEGGPDEVRAG